MITYDEKLNLISDFNGLYEDNAISDRLFYPEFRRKWDSVLNKAASLDDYSVKDDDYRAIYTVNTTFCGLDVSFNFDQNKIGEWFSNEQKRNSKAIFYPKRLKRSSGGVITYHDSVCTFDPDAPEEALSEDGRNIIACAIPEIVPKLNVVYGNKWVEDKFNVFLRRSISMYLIETDYVPAFLLSPFEVGEYLFMMDYCIIKADYTKVKDEDLRNFLHIFRPSPMLKIKGLL